MSPGAAQDPFDLTSAINTAINVFFYSIWRTNDLIATIGGTPFDNWSTTYVGSFDDAALDAGVKQGSSLALLEIYGC